LYYVGNNSENDARPYGKVPVQEGVLCVFIVVLVRLRVSNHVDNVSGSGDVEDLHDAVVKAVVGREEVQVARDENDQVQLLRLDGDAVGIFGDSEAEEEHEY